MKKFIFSLFVFLLPIGLYADCFSDYTDATSCSNASGCVWYEASEGGSYCIDSATGSSSSTASSSSSSSSSSSVPAPDTSAGVTKGVDNDKPDVGDTVTFTITATNEGDPQRIRIYDNLNGSGSTPGAFKYLSHTLTSNPGNKVKCDITNSNTRVYCYVKQGLLFGTGESFTVEIKVEILKAGKVRNRVRVYSKRPTGSGWREENGKTITFGEELELGGVGINKSVNTATSMPDKKVEYTIVVTNSDGLPKKLRLRDYLNRHYTTPDTFDYATYSIVDQSDGNINCSIKNSNNRNLYLQCITQNEYDVGDSFTVKLIFKIKPGVEPDQTVCNAAHVNHQLTTGSWNPWKDRITSTACLDVISNGDIKIEKDVDDDNPYEGDIITFSIKATNEDEKKYINFRDYIYARTSAAITDPYAFDYISHTITDNAGSVSCTVGSDDDGKYIDCKTTREFDVDESFEVEIKAYVKTEVGEQCNTVQSYLGVWNDVKNLKDSDKKCLDVQESDIELSKTVDNDKPSVDQEVIFTVVVENKDTKKSITMRDGVNGEWHTTDGAFELVGSPVVTDGDATCSTKGSGTDLYVECRTTRDLDVGETFTVQMRAKVLKEGELCNKAYIYPLVPGWGVVLNYHRNDKVCVDAQPSPAGSGTIPGFSSGSELDFELINPEATRNIYGNYVVTGNTLQCLTDKKRTFDGTCQDNPNDLNNELMTKYIDIDGDASTYNSSSSTFDLPAGNAPFPQVLWAGLFWQGSYNLLGDRTASEPQVRKQRHAISDGTSVTYTNNTSSDEQIDLSLVPINEIKYKIGSGAYQNAEADKFHFSDITEGSGGSYAAYADITSYLQSLNLTPSSTNTITVANAFSTEGREFEIGNSAGWSLVVIYAEDSLSATSAPRNISTYFGYAPVSASLPLTVSPSGFKLPKSGDVTSQLSVFASEGENRFTGDKMLLDNNDSFITGAKDNVFNASLSGVNRVPGSSNSLDNTNSIDIKNYDVSTVMRNFRDRVGIANATSVDIDLTTGLPDTDVYNVSMISFSTELYKPNICYKYSLSLDNFVLPSVNNIIRSPFGNQTGTNLVTRVAIQSLEGDFALEETNITYRIVDTSELEYVTGSTSIAPNNSFNYTPAPAHNENSAGFGMYIGNGATNGSGGKIDSFETRYIKWENSPQQYDINTTFVLQLGYKIDYGSGPLSLVKPFDESSECNTSGGGYSVDAGIFNVTSDQANNTGANAGEPFNLYTQVADREFPIKVFHYDSDHTTLKDFTGNVEIELYNADYFNGDANWSCNNPDSNISFPEFINFSGTNTLAIPSQQYNIANRNTGFRVVYLVDDNGSAISHNCTDRSQEPCFATVYDTNYKAADINRTTPLCNVSCNSLSPSGCYQCLRTYFGGHTCSRDNFSLRPVAYKIALSDTNNSLGVSNLLHVNNNTDITDIAAGYNYHLDINATGMFNPDVNTKGYYTIIKHKDDANISAPLNDTVGLFYTGKSAPICNDTNSTFFSAVFWNGRSINTLRAPNVGEYSFYIRDANWTTVDNPGNFPGAGDCIENSNEVDFYGANHRVGCLVTSDYQGVASGDFYDTPVVSNPYSFNLSGVTFGAPDTTFVYMNNVIAGSNPMIQTASGLIATEDLNMSISFIGDVFATGADNNSTPLSNFTDGCYAYDLKFTVGSNNSDRSGFWNTSQLNSFVLQLTENNSSSKLNTTALATNEAQLSASRFETTDLGVANARLYTNLPRAVNNPLNPVDINFSRLSAECLNATECSSNADGLMTIVAIGYEPTGDNNYSSVDSNRTFVYGRAHAPRYRAGCDASVLNCNTTSTIFYEIYYDNGSFTVPPVYSYLSTGANRSSDSLNWYKNILHTPASGVLRAIGDNTDATFMDTGSRRLNTPIQSASAADPVDQVAIVDVNGTTQVNYTYDGSQNYPFKVRVLTGTNPWLVYNRFDPLAIQNEFILEFNAGAGAQVNAIDQTNRDSNISNNPNTTRRIRW